MRSPRTKSAIYILKKEKFEEVKTKRKEDQVLSADELKKATGIDVGTLKKILGDSLSRYGKTAGKIEPVTRSTMEDFLKWLLSKDVDKNMLSEYTEINSHECRDLLSEDNECVNVHPEDTTEECSDNSSNDIREKISSVIKQRCAKHRILTMKDPVELDDIYVNLQEEVSIPNKINAKITSGSLRLLIIGALGAGKTTYLKKLALDINNKNKVAPSQVPFFINLRDYVETIKENDMNLVDFIADSYNIETTELKHLLEGDGENDKTVILLDSLDQIYQPDNSELVKRIVDFIEDYPKNDYIISSREITEVSILENFEVVKFKDIEFSDKNPIIKKFIQKRMEIILGKKNSKIQSTVEKILEDLKNEKNQLNTLATKPLMLAMICIEYAANSENHSIESEGLMICIEHAANSENHSIESKGLASTWHIVQRAIKIWIEEWNREFWESQHENDNNPISIIFIHELLNYIAYQTIEEEILSISRSRLIKYIRSFAKKYYEWSDNMRIDRFAQLIFQFLKDTYGFTLISENDIYSFPHTIFRDFFAIRYIYNNSQDLEEFKNNVANNISKWQTIIDKADAFPKKFL